MRVGKAVLRNRVKRRVREVFRLNRAELPQGWDFLVNPREAAARVPFEALQKELLRLFRQVGGQNRPPSPGPGVES